MAEIPRLAHCALPPLSRYFGGWYITPSESQNSKKRSPGRAIAD
jgi:hypothetical protein